MPQAGYQAVQVYYSLTSGHVPDPADMLNGEFAINIPDRKLFVLKGGEVVLFPSVFAFGTFNEIDPDDVATPEEGSVTVFSSIVDGISCWFMKNDQGAVIQFSSGNQPTGGYSHTITPDSPTAHLVKEADNGGLLVFDTASDCTITLPEQATDPLQEGFFVLAKNVGGGNVRLLTEGTDTLEGISLFQTPSLAVTIFLQIVVAASPSPAPSDASPEPDGPNTWSLIGNDWIPTYIIDDSLSAPPGVYPATGSVYIVVDPGSGAWTGHGNEFAIAVGSASWEFLDSAFADLSAGWPYKKVVAGIVEDFYRDSTGQVVQITSNGHLAGSQSTDADIVALTAEVDALQISVTALEGDVTTLEGDVTTLEGDVSDLQAEVAGISGGNELRFGTGTINGDTLNLEVTFSTAFPTACLYLVVSGEVVNTLQDGQVGNGTTANTASKGYISNSDNVSHKYYYIAVGN